MLDDEQELLDGLRAYADDELTLTLPRVVQRVQTSVSSTGLVVTAPHQWLLKDQPVPTQPASPKRETARLLDATGTWLYLLWQQTAHGESVPTTIGSEGARWLVELYPRASLKTHGIDDLLRAQRSMATHSARRTVGHGCLCPRHVTVVGDRVVAVEDWGLGSQSTDPLTDLGEFAVRLAGNRLAEVLIGRSTFGSAVRKFVSTGLVRTGIPARGWRDLVMLAHLDRAHRASARGDADPSLLISMLVKVLPE